MRMIAQCLLVVGHVLEEQMLQMQKGIAGRVLVSTHSMPS